MFKLFVLVVAAFGLHTHSFAQGDAPIQLLTCDGKFPTAENREKSRTVFSTQANDHLHLTAPAYMLICEGGGVTMVLAHAANMRRTGLLDSGSQMCFNVEVQFIQDPTCQEPAFSTRKFQFFCLGYKREVFNASYMQGGPDLKDDIQRAGCFRSTAQWESPFK